MMYDNNQFNQFGANPYAMPMGSGMQYMGAQQPVTKQSNILTAEEIAMLTKKENQFSLGLTELDKKKAACNHRKADGSGDTLIENPDGTVTCSICGYTFKPLDAQMTTQETLNAAVADIIDVLQTIKILWIDVDNDAAREYFQIIPLIQKIPALFDLSVKNFSKHESAMPWVNSNKNMSTMQAFQMLSSLLQNPMAQQQFAQPQVNGFAQNPYMGQPMYQGAPQMNPQMVPPQQGQPVSNGFGYVGVGPMGNTYQAQTQGYQTTYGAQPQPAAAPTVNPAPAQTAAPAANTKDAKTTNASLKA